MLEIKLTTTDYYYGYRRLWILYVFICMHVCLYSYVLIALVCVYSYLHIFIYSVGSYKGLIRLRFVFWSLLSMHCNIH